MRHGDIFFYEKLNRNYLKIIIERHIAGALIYINFLFVSDSDHSLELGDVDLLALTESQERQLTEDLQSVTDKDTSTAVKGASATGSIIAPATSNSVQPMCSIPLYPTFNYEEIQHRHQSNAPIYYFNNSTVNIYNGGR